MSKEKSHLEHVDTVNLAMSEPHQCIQLYVSGSYLEKNRNEDPGEMLISSIAKNTMKPGHVPTVTEIAMILSAAGMVNKALAEAMDLAVKAIHEDAPVNRVDPA